MSGVYFRPALLSGERFALRHDLKMHPRDIADATLRHACGTLRSNTGCPPVAIRATHRRTTGTTSFAAPCAAISLLPAPGDCRHCPSRNTGSSWRSSGLPIPRSRPRLAQGRACSILFFSHPKAGYLIVTYKCFLARSCAASRPEQSRAFPCGRFVGRFENVRTVYPTT